MTSNCLAICCFWNQSEIWALMHLTDLIDTRFLRQMSAVVWQTFRKFNRTRTKIILSLWGNEVYTLNQHPSWTLNFFFQHILQATNNIWTLWTTVVLYCSYCRNQWQNGIVFEKSENLWRVLQIFNLSIYILPFQVFSHYAILKIIV